MTKDQQIHLLKQGLRRIAETCELIAPSMKKKFPKFSEGVTAIGKEARETIIESEKK